MDHPDPQRSWPAASAVAHDTWTARDLLFRLQNLSDELCPADFKARLGPSAQLWSDGHPGQRDRDRTVALVVPLPANPVRLVVLTTRHGQYAYRQPVPVPGGTFTFTPQNQDGPSRVRLSPSGLPTERELRAWGFHPDLSAPVSAWMPGDYHWTPAQTTGQTRLGLAGASLAVLALGAWGLTGHLNPYLTGAYRGFSPVFGFCLTLVSLALLSEVFLKRPTQAAPHARYLEHLQALMDRDLTMNTGLYAPDGASPDHPPAELPLFPAVQETP